MDPSEIVSAAVESSSLQTFRKRVLERLVATFEAERGMYLAAGPAPPASTRALVNLEASQMRTLEANWPRYAADVEPLLRHLYAHGVASARQVYGDRWEQMPFYREIARPLNLPCNILIDVSLPHSSRGFLLLGRGDGREFDQTDADRLLALRPYLCVSDVAMRAARADMTSSLGETEQEIIKCVRLGYTNQQTAVAIGVSPFTVRNRLSELYTRFGVGTRAELVGLFTEPE